MNLGPERGVTFKSWTTAPSLGLTAVTTGPECQRRGRLPRARLMKKNK